MKILKTARSFIVKNDQISSFVLKAAAACFSLLLVLLVSRSVSLKEAGIIFTFSASLTLLSGLCRLGWDNLLIREIGSCRVGTKDCGNGQTIYRAQIDANIAYTSAWFSGLTGNIFTGLVVLASAYGAIGSLGYSKWVASTETAEIYSIVFILCLFFHSWTRINTFALLGVRRYGWSIFCSELLYAISTLIVFFFVQNKSIETFMLCSLASSVLTCVVSQILLGESAVSFTRVTSEYVMGKIRPLFFFFVTKNTTLGTQHGPTILLAVLAGPVEAAIFALAQRIVMGLALLSNSINLIAAPKIARYKKTDEIKKMNDYTLTITNYTSLVGSFVFIFIVIFSGAVLSLFSELYAKSPWALLILSFAYSLSMCCGPSAIRLTMTNRESYESRVSFCCAVFLLILLMLLVPDFGAIGAAISVGISLLSKQFLCVWHILKHDNVLLFFPRLTSGLRFPFEG